MTMKRFLILALTLLIMAPMAMAQSQGKKGAKEVSPFIEGKQKVRMTDYDSIWKFTVFDQKKIYYCNFDYSQLPTLLEDRRPAWGNFTPVMNYLTTVSRSPMRICAIWAVNPNISDPEQKRTIEEQAKQEALESLQALQSWMANKDMRNKVQLQVAQVDYRYWQGTDYFIKEQTSDPLVHVGVILFFGTKKISLFHSAGDGAQTFADVKFFPNDATIQESYLPELENLASYMKEHSGLEVLLTGYSDNTFCGNNYTTVFPGLNFGRSLCFGYLLGQYLTDNDVEAHIEKAKELYKKKAELMMDCIAKYCPEGCSFTKPEGGMFIWVTVPEGVKAIDVQREAVKHNVVTLPGDPFYEYERDVRTMRLNYSNSTDEAIETGIKILGDAIRTVMNKQ